MASYDSFKTPEALAAYRKKLQDRNATSALRALDRQEQQAQTNKERIERRDRGWSREQILENQQEANYTHTKNKATGATSQEQYDKIVGAGVANSERLQNKYDSYGGNRGVDKFKRDGAGDMTLTGVNQQITSRYESQKAAEGTVQFTPGGNPVLNDRDRKLSALLRQHALVGGDNMDDIKRLGYTDEELAKFTPGGNLIMGEHERKYAALLQASANGVPGASEKAALFYDEKTNTFHPEKLESEGVWEEKFTPLEFTGEFSSDSQADAYASLMSEYNNAMSHIETLEGQDQAISEDLAGGAATYGGYDEGKVDGAVSGGFQPGDFQYDEFDYDTVLQQIEDQEKIEDDAQTKNLEDKLGIQRERMEEDIEDQKKRIEQEKQSAMRRFFGEQGGLEGELTSSGALLPVVVEEAGVKNLKEYQRALQEFDVDAEKLLQDLDADQKAEIQAQMAQKITQWDDEQDNKYTLWKEKEDKRWEQHKYGVENEKWAITEQRQQDTFNLNVKKYYGEVIGDLADKYGDKMVGGALADYYKEIGIEIDESFFDMDTTEAFIQDMMGDMDKLEAFSDLSPAAREAFMTTIPEIELKENIRAFNNALLEEERLEKLEEGSKKDKDGNKYSSTGLNITGSDYKYDKDEGFTYGLPKDRPYGSQCGGYVNDQLGTPSQYGNTLASKTRNIINQGNSNPIEGGTFIMDVGTTYGHVGLVEKVYDDGSFRVRDMNRNNNEQMSTRTIHRERMNTT